MTKSLLEILSLLFSGALVILAGIFKDNLTAWIKTMSATLFKSKHESIPPEHSARERRINDLCVELRLRLNADRAYVIKFHNGEYFSPIDPMWKITCTHENCRPGIAYTIQEVRSIIVSSIIDVVDPLLGGTRVPGTSCVFRTILDSNGLPICGNREDESPCVDTPDHRCTARTPCWYDINMMDDNSTKAFVVEHGVKFMMLAQIVNQGQVIGLVGVDFCRDLNTLEIAAAKTSTEILQDFTNQITYIIKNVN